LESAQEIFTLDKRYTFSLNTNLGHTTKFLDPDLISKLISKESRPRSRPDDGKPFFGDKSIGFSLEIKF
jgi:hypothetical protein